MTIDPLSLCSVSIDRTKSEFVVLTGQGQPCRQGHDEGQGHDEEQGHGGEQGGGERGEPCRI